MKFTKPQVLLAFDLGASSGRGIVGSFQSGKLVMEEIHRFENTPITDSDRLCWDLPALLAEIKTGIHKACQKYQIESIAFDTWGVDYGLIDARGQLLHLPYHYRDDFSQASFQLPLAKEDLFLATGNQVMAINSVFRLAQELKDAAVAKKCRQVLLMPDLIGYLLTGVAKGEGTIAATSQLYNPETGDWHQNLAKTFGIDPTILPKLVPAGSFVGFLQDPTFPKIPVYKSFGHDTACAVASIPTEKNDFLFISCGTWALAGTVTEKPILNQKACLQGFSNEGGQLGENRLLKNLTGLWIIQELRRDLADTEKSYSFQEMMELASRAKDTVLIDTQLPQLAKPGKMIAKISTAMKEQGHPPASNGELIRCVYQSLAATFKATFAEIQSLTGKNYQEIHIIGGGAQADFLCQAIADTCQKTVIAGPIEATAMGNLAAQGLGLGYLGSIAEFRRQISGIEKLTTYQPKQKLVPATSI